MQKCIYFLRIAPVGQYQRELDALLQDKRFWGGGFSQNNCTFAGWVFGWSRAAPRYSCVWEKFIFYIMKFLF